MAYQIRDFCHWWRIGLLELAETIPVPWHVKIFCIAINIVSQVLAVYKLKYFK